MARLWVNSYGNSTTRRSGAIKGAAELDRQSKTNRMSIDKKNFFHNPSWRLMVHILAWTFLKCFQFLALFNPKLKEMINKYQSGHATAPAIIGFASGLIFEILFVIIIHEGIYWSIETSLRLTLFYVLGLMGWLSLVKEREYERE